MDKILFLSYLEEIVEITQNRAAIFIDHYKTKSIDCKQKIY